MVIDVYSGFSKKPNSTKQPSGSPRASITCRLKEPCSVLNPVFLLTGYNLSDNYVKWGSRYYYIDDIVIIANELAEYHCSTDVLATYKANIGSSSQYVVRSSATSDGNVIDSIYPTKNNPTSKYQSLSNIANTYDISHGEFVVGVKNGDAATGVKYYGVRASVFRDLVAVMYGGSWLDATEISNNLQKLLVDPMQYISSITWYPFDVTPVGATAEQIKFGYYNAATYDPACLGYVIDDTNRIYSVTDPVTLPDHPQISRGAYLNGSPYTRITLDVFGFGRVPIDPDLFVNSRACSVQIAVDLFTGVGELTVESTNGRALKMSSMVGVPVQLSQVTQDIVKAAFAVIDTAQSIVSKNYVGAAADIMSAVESMFPQVQTAGSVGSIMAYNKTPEIRLVHYELVDEDNAQLGRPLCKVRTISSIAGFIQCDRADLDLPASPSEKDQILNYLNGGFYYE